MNLLPLLLNLTLPLQRGRPLLPASHRDAGEPDWRSAYQRLRGEEQPPVDEPVMPMPTLTPPRGGTESEPEAAEARTSTARIDASRRAAPARDPGESPRHAAAQTPRAEDSPLLQAAWAPLPLPAEFPAELSEARPAPSTLASPAAARIEALLQRGEPAPVARVWQVELPGAGPAWQLQVQQAQPQAPLNLELRVPPVAQSQARQQLGDLDKRLRDAGHDVLRSRLRDSRGRGPVEGVKG
ncbi:MAG TPA: hypothetical protein VIN03_13630 [Roseateles sp.]